MIFLVTDIYRKTKHYTSKECTMILLNPQSHTRNYSDPRSKEIMIKTIEFFEKRGKEKLKEDDRERTWYSDFLDFQKKEKIFATMLTPPNHSSLENARWDTWRNCEFNEILGFYGLCYWYTWQVSILGLGPIWMSKNEPLQKKTAKFLEDGEIFAFGLSEKEHGADLYSSEMKLVPSDSSKNYKANGEKYYIGNANEAAIVSTFGTATGPKDYVYFAVNSQHDNYECVENVVNSQSYVAHYKLKDYPINESDIISRGEEAWDAGLNTVNIGKYNLGWASIGISTHAFYEAINHAFKRSLYGMKVTDFPHVKRLFVDAYCRLTSMKLFALRTADYVRTATKDDRRYLLFNPLVKMKVCTQGEDVINHLWDVIAAKGFEKNMYFDMAARDIRALPKLEGTVHVNIALIIKFMRNYFFNHKEYKTVGTIDQTHHDEFLFDQGPTRGLSKIRFHDYRPIFKEFNLPNVKIFRKQMSRFKLMIMMSPPNKEQRKDTDFLMALGELFSLIVYAQLILENARAHKIDDQTLNQIFNFLVRDFSKFSIDLYSKSSSTALQRCFCKNMTKKPKPSQADFNHVWQVVESLVDTYEMPK